VDERVTDLQVASANSCIARFPATTLWYLYTTAHENIRTCVYYGASS
jgi:hypothetical protein